MKTSSAFVGARGTDSLTLLNATSAQALHNSGMDFCLQYLGSVKEQGLADILASGLAFMPVTYANRFDGKQTVTQLKALNMPEECTVWLDVEDVATMEPMVLQGRIDTWAQDIINAKYQPGLYVGAGCPLTSVELYRLKVVRYWHSLSKVIDRNGQLAEPSCGYCMKQLFPSISWAGVWVDVNAVYEDYRNRLPNWVKL